MLFIASLLFMLVAFGVLYNLAKWLKACSRKREEKKRIERINKINEEKRAYIEKFRLVLGIPENSTEVGFDALFHWEDAQDCKNLVFSPAVSELSFQINSTNPFFCVNQDDKLGLNFKHYILNATFDITAPVSGVFEVLLPDKTWIKGGQTIAKIHTGAEYISELKRGFILSLQNNTEGNNYRKCEGIYGLLKRELSDDGGKLRFEKFFRWDTNDGYYTLIYAPVYENMKLHYYNFYTPNTGKLQHIYRNNEISLDVDYYSFGKMSSIKVPVEGILEYAVPSFVSADFISGINILKIDTNREAIEAFEREKKEEARRMEEIALQAEKQRIAEKIKKKQKRYELEKIVRQELIDSGELFGDQSKRPPIPRELVDAVYRRDGGRCVNCGSTENLQLDHIIPFSKGGATTIENLQLLCQKCNLEKSNHIG